jgi:DNA gyrase subunit A
MEIAPLDSELFVVTERGYGKRTPMSDYPIQRRGGMGVKTIQVTPKKGPLAGMKIVLPAHELMLISEEGVIIRVRAEAVSRLGRSTQGVKVMNVPGTDRVCGIARVTGGKKRKARVAEGQGQLVPEAATGPTAPSCPAPVSEAEREAAAEELASEEFEDLGEE